MIEKIEQNLKHYGEAIFNGENLKTEERISKHYEADIDSSEKVEIRHINVLYLDDDADILDSYKSMHRFDFNIFTTTDPFEAKDIIATNEIQIIITDQRMPYMTGLEFFSLISEEYPDPIRILLTGYVNTNTILDAIESKIIYSQISKPFSPKQMMQTIKNAAGVYYSNKKEDYKQL
jgi:DNA-binding NtrC family response regulator